jgi:hypothetical protein
MMELKMNSGNIEPFSGRSDVLITTQVAESVQPRTWYLTHSDGCLHPCISSSEFVPRVMIEHLMRKKKDAALGVKFKSGNTPPDAITNMEGAMHTFVTPVVLASLHGDYVYSSGHGVSEFPCINKLQQARTVIMSAQIQPDFEGPHVLQTLCALHEDPLIGEALPGNFSILSIADKQSPAKRAAYDASLQYHMIAHLTEGRRLPSLQEAAPESLDVKQSIAFLEDLIYATSPKFDRINGVSIRLQKGPVLSLEMLFKTALHQLRNELSALEALSPQGYVYTSDPPAIFAQQIGATVLNRLQFAALKGLAFENALSNMRVFAFNDYADRGAINLLKHTLSTQPHVRVVNKSLLFKGPRNTYSPLAGTEGLLLVIHNNADAFGQNIETERGLGSMDSAIGIYSSAAACLKRDRPDLVASLM